ncbi:putative hydroquinone glucosyltransferase-like [Heracleum sosnowskyi]|uniref:Glycosyltransferase n=1 Tax=Heracleum sosnowskyi TaxID=360622 RepID=A0AAD8IPE0_9APIA|nr:putative hydroquinone glucosyltransferase-like [Heracleum sosnowskyi]
MVSAKDVTKPRIAFLPSPGLGHLIPLLEFAKHLVIHHNVHVSFLVINTEAPAMQHQLLNPSTLPSDLHVIHLPPADVSSCVNDNMNIVTQLTYICQESLKPLRATLVELNLPKALIIDIFATDAFLICKELGIPVYSFFTSPTKLLALSFYLPKLDKEVECEFMDLPHPIQVPGCKPLQTYDLLDLMFNRKDEEYRCYLQHVSRLTMAAGVFLNTWDDLEQKSNWLNAIKNDPFYKTLPVPPIYPVGPLIKRDEAVSESDEFILSWLNNQLPNSVLLVSFGSGGTLTSEQLTELAIGLEMSKQKFILVVRKPSDLSAHGTFFNVGRDHDDPVSYLPEGFMKRTGGQGLVVPSWAPQVKILGHEATGGFLSHCGWNSSLESLVHGVPMIVWPLYAEQRMNATLLTEEVGVAVKPMGVLQGGRKVVKKEEVERVVRLVMQGEEGKVMRNRMRELKDSAAKALKFGGSSYSSLSYVVKSWK